MNIARSLILVACAGLGQVVYAGEAVVAVASNFAPATRTLVQEFIATSKHDVRVVAGSTGSLYAQIINGAPFDVFLSADLERPRDLELQGHAVAGSRFTYALGQLVLWSRNPQYEGKNCFDELGAMGNAKLAIANPRLAPYGLAAEQYLRSVGLWDRLQANLVMGENIAQTLQFAARGGANLGFVAAAQLSMPTLPAATCVQPVPANSHAPIRQQAVLLLRASDNEAARAFLQYLKSPAGRATIVKAGYALEGEST
ncbi:MAG TPA: molybdate ABC transporter substrate-binding protein [Woeseiaceae bacterium]|nr:molybdate ABC transporter substrate-binding protein [Woeseiaceae bacterium]